MYGDTPSSDSIHTLHHRLHLLVQIEIIYLTLKYTEDPTNLMLTTLIKEATMRVKVHVVGV